MDDTLSHPFVRHEPGRVLVVDDDSTLRTLLRVVLETAGHHVVGAGCDGAAAIRLAERLRPEIVTMDIEMPVLDGVAATQEIVRCGLADVVIVSSIDPGPRLADAMAAGAGWHVRKTEIASTLAPTIDAALERRRRAALDAFS